VVSLFYKHFTAIDRVTNFELVGEEAIQYKSHDREGWLG
jgi:hypothetical protein